MRFSIALLPIFFALVSIAQQKQRLTENWEFVQQDLGGIWEAVRPYKPGSPEALPSWQTVTLPHCYNATDAVAPDVNYYQGPAWYRTSLDINNPYTNGRVLLHFEGAGQKTMVYIHTEKVAEHVGGYDEWTVDITEAVDAFKATEAYATQFQGRVPLSIRCDNSRDLELIPSDLSDFNLYGGIYRYLNLLYVPRLSVDKLFATATVDAKGHEGHIQLSALFHNPGKVKEADVAIELLGPDGRRVASQQHRVVPGSGPTVIDGIAVKHPARWSPANPSLYTVRLTVAVGTDTATHTERIGFRHFEFAEKGPFYLNGERLLLRGTHRHEDHAGVGAAMTEEMIWQEMRMMKDMGVNFIRLGHYQQSRIVLEACDSLGILVWEEIPWCRGGLGGDVYKEQARRMLTNMIEQHYNHPAVIIWGLGNENDWPGDFAEFDQQKIRAFMKELHDLSHQLDPTRKTAIRRCDFCKDIVDVYSPSIWAGWYRGIYTDYRTASHTEFEKVDHFLHVEWGGDSHARRHSENPDNGLTAVMHSTTADERAGDASLFGGPARVSKDGDWSESYICNLIDWHLKEQETMPWLTGTAYWPFKDFSTPIRPENPVPYVNQKGVVERNFNKKESYYIFQSYWADKPMAHIYGHSWPVRWGRAGEEKMVKVYSNCTEAELFVNGVSQGVRQRNSQDFPAAGLRWMVVLRDGQNTLEVVARKDGATVRDSITQVYQTAVWGKPAAMQLSVLEAAADTVTIQATLLDKSGVLCLDAADYIRFAAIGDGYLLADLGTSDGSRTVQAYNGRAVIRLKRTGRHIAVAAAADSLETALLQLPNLAAQADSFETAVTKPSHNKTMEDARAHPTGKPGIAPPNIFYPTLKQ
ncbi:glycoside hydrolase family 2 TIM barrel-domain containing protein [Parapedobacter sp. 2B3]|uniref:glycoside hydrolase family 2 TIM barrel-domain containing protein n=1 Tax=Parapedobacter sp. 2B3 TaxID=3342381 RepID=UPI0035B6555C